MRSFSLPPPRVCQMSKKVQTTEPNSFWLDRKRRFISIAIKYPNSLVPCAQFLSPTGWICSSVWLICQAINLDIFVWRLYDACKTMSFYSKKRRSLGGIKPSPETIRWNHPMKPSDWNIWRTIYRSLSYHQLDGTVMLGYFLIWIPTHGQKHGHFISFTMDRVRWKCSFACARMNDCDSVVLEKNIRANQVPTPSPGKSIMYQQTDRRTDRLTNRHTQFQIRAHE